MTRRWRPARPWSSFRTADFDRPPELVIGRRFAPTRWRAMMVSAVIASEAKQSILPRKERVDCFAALAMTLIESRIDRFPHTTSFSRRGAPEACCYLRAQRGRGECRMPAAPAASCALVVVESTRVTTSTPESPGIPARNGFTAYFELSPVTGLFCHRRLRSKVLSAPGRADRTSANLTPASGRQDHTTSPYAGNISRPRAVDRSQAHRPPCDPVARKTLPRPPHPHPASVTIAIRPLWWGGMARICRDDLPDG
jgi:hypothetical protein